MKLSPFALLALLLPACAGRLEGMIQDQASTDFGCDRSDITVRQKAPYNTPTRYFNVEGCGKHAIYNGSCPLFMCQAQAQGSPRDINEEPPPRMASSPRPTGDEGSYDGSGDERVGGDENPGGDGRDERPTSGSSSSSRPSSRPEAAPPKQPAKPAGPAIVSITFRNTCPKTVRTFEGTKPKFGSGVTSSLGANTSTSLQRKAGQMIWIVDDKDNGLASVTLAEGVRTVEIGRDCTSLSMK